MAIRSLIVEPTFDMYRFFAELAGARVIALRYDEEMRFPVDAVVRELRQPQKRAPRVLYIANPNNPTGTLVRARRICAEFCAPLRTRWCWSMKRISIFRGSRFLPWIRRYPNLLVARTFSKSAGLAALRIGCLFGKPEILAAMRRACTPYPGEYGRAGGGGSGDWRSSFSARITRGRFCKAARCSKRAWFAWARGFIRAARISCSRISARRDAPGARPRTERNSGARAAGFPARRICPHQRRHAGRHAQSASRHGRNSCEAGAQTRDF